MGCRLAITHTFQLNDMRNHLRLFQKCFNMFINCTWKKKKNKRKLSSSLVSKAYFFFFKNAMTLEEMKNVTLSHLAPGDHNSIIPFTCRKEGMTTKVLSWKSLRGVGLIEWNHDCWSRFPISVHSSILWNGCVYHHWCL